RELLPLDLDDPRLELFYLAGELLLPLVLALGAAALGHPVAEEFGLLLEPGDPLRRGKPSVASFVPLNLGEGEVRFDVVARHGVLAPLVGEGLESFVVG